ncbi:TetR/AcrR family transcriptional regulator [Pseudokordiimonas caeni]|uniref:TetR/AcrR family transcriptional regulator n=1 Tax=Pseudokordiimonas caeni TaxID=2997908 RepID=UPI002810A3E5|nr:TetR/AcrR family transcriptional regulator [Pseudokordiimonas caeni]
MRYDKDHKERTRQAILKEAAQQIREHGPENVGIKSIMASAGLTVGGFYAHFASKDDLVAAAISTMFDLRSHLLERSLEGHEPEEGLTLFVDRYLSEVHVANHEQGCPLPALSADVARLDVAAKESFAAGYTRLSAKIAVALEKMGRKDAALAARSILSELVGALSMARSISDGAEREAVLAASRASIKARLKG